MDSVMGGLLSFTTDDDPDDDVVPPGLLLLGVEPLVGVILLLV